MQYRVWVGFAGLCLLSGSAWILDGYAPGFLSGLLRAAVHLGLLGAIFWVSDAVLRRGAPVAQRVWMQVALWGAALFAVPQVVFAISRGRVPRLTEVLIFTLVPAVVVFMETQGAAGFGFGENGMQRIVPALTGFGGVAMLLPLVLPGSSVELAWFVADGMAAVLAGLAIVQMHRLLAGANLLRAAGVLKVTAVVCGSAAVVCGICSGAGASAVGAITKLGVVQEGLRCLGFDGPVLLLTIWLLGRMRPSAFAGQYLIVPLVTVIEGYVWLRPQTHWTMAAGTLLVVGASAMLVVSDGPAASEGELTD